MKLNLLPIVCCLILISCQNQAQNKKETSATTTKSEVMAQGDIYSFKVKDIEGKEFDFESLRGKKVMIVNTASKCGLTPQYKELQSLYEQYKDSDFVIIGFPANDFMEQEPGSEKEIAAFCERNYGVTFPMMSKVSVKGKEMEPVYQYLTQKSQNGVKDSEVEWNFQKYLINKNGQLEKVISPRVSPTDDEILEWIQS
ncbi:glutathione peroxidase [Flavobacterium sp.]|jgi:glutathione peroxidase|uniref:glutathione peroxidase n=1 Tax=Flavobacterium sp. TaxID=239 RepID=UPI0037BF7836